MQPTGMWVHEDPVRGGGLFGATSPAHLSTSATSTCAATARPSVWVMSRAHRAAASVFVADDGRSYLLHEHQTASRFRVLPFDAQGTTRTRAVDIPSDAECAGGARTGVLSLNRGGGKFVMACERTDGHGDRRFDADGTPIDGAFVDLAGFQAR